MNFGWTNGYNQLDHRIALTRAKKPALLDKLFLRKRALIGSVIDQFKSISQIEHSRHRSVPNFLINLAAGLIAYTYQEKKPSLNLRSAELDQLPAVVL